MLLTRLKRLYRSFPWSTRKSIVLLVLSLPLLKLLVHTYICGSFQVTERSNPLLTSQDNPEVHRGVTDVQALFERKRKSGNKNDVTRAVIIIADRAALVEMENRRSLVQEACILSRERRPETTHHLLVSRKYRLLYCPVEKAASTFWRRFLYQLEHTDPVRSPFEVSIQTAYDAINTTFFDASKQRDFHKLLKTTTKLLYVRDPYTRLFSAYVDKLLSPNPIFWDLWGKRAILRFRTQPHLTEPCGNDVTFQEFISLVIGGMWKFDSHLMPIFFLCTPCNIKYNVIGRMETFSRDVSYLLSLLQINPNQIRLDKISDEVLNDAVEDSTLDAYSDDWLKETLKCISKLDAAKRTWRRMQLRGFISWRVNFDLDPKSVEDMDATEYSLILKRAAEISTNKTELKLQKRQAFLEAFSGLYQSQLRSLWNLFDLDLRMFNYEKLSLLSFKYVQETGALDWKNNWDLTGVI